MPEADTGEETVTEADAGRDVLTDSATAGARKTGGRMSATGSKDVGVGSACIKGLAVEAKSTDWIDLKFAAGILIYSASPSQLYPSLAS